jgi:hypothetical protein
MLIYAEMVAWAILSGQLLSLQNKNLKILKNSPEISKNN